MCDDGGSPCTWASGGIPATLSKKWALPVINRPGVAGRLRFSDLPSYFGGDQPGDALGDPKITPGRGPGRAGVLRRDPFPRGVLPHRGRGRAPACHSPPSPGGTGPWFPGKERPVRGCLQVPDLPPGGPAVQAKTREGPLPSVPGSGIVLAGERAFHRKYILGRTSLVLNISLQETAPYVSRRPGRLRTDLQESSRTIRLR